jgi:hypothetical protein
MVGKPEVIQKLVLRGRRSNAQVLINAQTGQVGTGTHFSGNPTNQELTGPNACGV